MRDIIIAYVAIIVVVVMVISGLFVLVSCNEQCRMDRYATIYLACLDREILSTEDCKQFAIIGAWDS